MARMPEMLEPICRPSFGRNTWPWKEYRFFSVILRRSVVSCLKRWSIGFWILSTALVMATCMVIEVYKDTTSLRPTKPAQILKYDPLYLTSTDQPNASHGYWSTPSNRCWRTFQHIYSLELTKCIQAGDFTTNKKLQNITISMQPPRGNNNNETPKCIRWHPPSERISGEQDTSNKVPPEPSKEALDLPTQNSHLKFQLCVFLAIVRCKA